MRIMHTECSLDWGGQEYRTLLEHMYLNSHAHESWLLCDKRSKLYQEAKKLGAINILVSNLRNSWRFDLMLWILFQCKIKKIDIINTHGSRDSLLCCISFFAGVPIVRSRQIINPVKRKFSYHYLCSQIIASALIIKNNLKRIGVPRNKITVIDEGVCLNDFYPGLSHQYLQKEFNIDFNEKVIANIGMLRGDKGQIYFIEAANKLLKLRNDVKFIVVGDSVGNSSLKAELIDKIKEYGYENKILLTGYRSDVPEIISLADFIVISSLEEAQSRIAPQAFACKKTVIATNVGGLPELVINGKTGLLVPPKDSDAIVNAMLKLLDDNQLKEKLENECYELAKKRLSFDEMMKNILNVYAQVINHQSKFKFQFTKGIF